MELLKCKTCQTPLKNGNVKYCSHKCRRRERNFICKNCGKSFEVEKFSIRVYCSWVCVLQARKPKMIKKNTLVNAMLNYRHGDRPNFAAIATLFKTRNGVMIVKWAKSYGLLDNNYKGPIVNGVYLPIPDNAIKSHPIKSTPFTKKNLIKRLLKRCEKDEVTGCWIWVGNWNSQGYGKMRLARPFDKNVSVHVIAAHIWLKEPLPTTKLVFKKCNNRACFNPKHMILCNDRFKLAEMCKKYGRRVKGEKNGRAIISLETALDIRDALSSGEKPKQIAVRLGVKSHIVWQISRRKTWKHIWKLKHEYQGVKHV